MSDPGTPVPTHRLERLSETVATIARERRHALEEATRLEQRAARPGADERLAALAERQRAHARQLGERLDAAVAEVRREEAVNELLRARMRGV